jgi:hypothetical protein
MQPRRRTSAPSSGPSDEDGDDSDEVGVLRCLPASTIVDAFSCVKQRQGWKEELAQITARLKDGVRWRGSMLSAEATPFSYIHTLPCVRDLLREAT